MEHDPLDPAVGVGVARASQVLLGLGELVGEGPEVVPQVPDEPVGALQAALVVVVVQEGGQAVDGVVGVELGEARLRLGLLLVEGREDELRQRADHAGARRVQLGHTAAIAGDERSQRRHDARRGEHPADPGA